MFCAQIITIGDHPKAETRKFFRDRILPDVPERLRSGLDFEKLYEAFGGKFAHWQDYVADYGKSAVCVLSFLVSDRHTVNSNGKLESKWVSTLHRSPDGLTRVI